MKPANRRPRPQTTRACCRRLHEYLAALEAGRRPTGQRSCARHPDLAGGAGRVPRRHRRWPRRCGRAAPVRRQAEYPADPLGDFRIVREIGRGGMGVVYEAVQLSLGRRVALKVLPFAAALDAQQLQRFQNEAQAAAQLHHTAHRAGLRRRLRARRPLLRHAVHRGPEPRPRVIATRPAAAGSAAAGRRVDGAVPPLPLPAGAAAVDTRPA